MASQIPAPPQWGQATTPQPQAGAPKKERHPILWTVVVVAAALVMLPAILSGNDTGSSTSSVNQPAEEATVLQAGSQEVGITRDIFGNQTAAIMVSKPKRSDHQSDYGIPPALVFGVAVVALKDNISTPEFYLLSPEGRKVDETYFYAGNERNLDFTTLQKDEKLAGTIAFDYPEEHGKLIVPGGDGKPQVTWTF